MQHHLHLHKETRNDHCSYTYIAQKAFSKFQFVILIKENKKLFTSSDDEDFNLDTTHLPLSWNGVISIGEISDQDQLASVTDVGRSSYIITCI